MPELVKKSRPDQLSGRTHKIETNAGKLFLTVNDCDGIPFEVFARVGKAGDDVMALCEAIGRLVSLSLRYGIPAPEVVEQLKGVGGDWPVTPSVPEAISRALGGGAEDGR